MINPTRNFRNRPLSRVDLHGAGLTGAILVGANLNGVNLADVKDIATVYRSEVVAPGQVPRGSRRDHGVAVAVSPTLR
jgi:Pentapeptide repeats (8 copies)